jgi:hypothetical protein
MATVKINEQQKELAIKVGVGIAAFFFCYAAIAEPVFRDISILRQSIQSSQKRIGLYREVRDLKGSLESNESVLATLTERSQLLGKISDIASKNDIRVQTLTPRTEPEGGYIKLRVEMDGQGGFLSLIKFLRSVEKIGAAIKVKDVSVLWKPSSLPGESKYYLQIRLVFETFLKQRVRKNA